MMITFVFMKLASLLFSLLIILMSTSPSLALIDFAEEEFSCSTTCCRSENESEPVSESDKECQSNCNPFVACGTCVGFQSERIELSHGLISVSSTLNTKYAEFVLTQFCYSVWHPPKSS